MKLAWSIVAGTLLILVLLVFFPWAWGLTLPAQYRVTQSREYPYSVALVWALVSDPQARVAWDSTLSRVEMLGPNNRGLPVWREYYSDSESITFEVTELVPLRRLNTRIVDTDLPFSGTWMVELEPVSIGTRVVVTEEGEITSPLIRFLWTYVVGYDATVRQYLSDLERGLAAAGEGATR